MGASDYAVLGLVAVAVVSIVIDILFRIVVAQKLDQLHRRVLKLEDEQDVRDRAASRLDAVHSVLRMTDEEARQQLRSRRTS